MQRTKVAPAVRRTNHLASLAFAAIACVAFVGGCAVGTTSDLPARGEGIGATDGAVSCSNNLWWNAGFSWSPGTYAINYWGYHWDNDLAVASGTAIQLRHASTLIEEGVHAWGWEPRFIDTVTGEHFAFLHLRPGSRLTTAIGTTYPAGTIVGYSGGDTADTGYNVSNGHGEVYSTGAHLCVTSDHAFATAFPPGTDGCGSSGSTSSCPAGLFPLWTCTSDHTARMRCTAGHVETDPCASGCDSQPSGTDDVCAPSTPTPSPTCRTSGQSCSASQPCCTALSCNGGTCGATPTPPPTPTCASAGAACSQTSDCCGTDTCQSGVCAAPATPPPSVSWSCGNSSYAGNQYWTCSSGNLYRCSGGTPEMQTCSSGCISNPVGTDDACAGSTPAPSSWTCSRSAYAGNQYWTCSGGALHRCDSSGAAQIRNCASGCAVRPLGTDDVCN